jgi:predicted amidophosphoribosyltransferase
MLRGDWSDDVAREGLAPVASVLWDENDVSGEEPPCPACGTAAPLVDGACSDCGLALG